MDNVTDIVDYRVTRVINVFIPPVILTVGFVANTLAFITLTKKNMRSSSVMALLTILAIVDNIVLCVGLLPYWMQHAFDTDVRTMSTAGCRTFKFLNVFFTCFCNWILTAVSIDRCVFVCFHHKARRFCCSRFVCLFAVVDGLAMFLLNINLFNGVDVVITHFGVACLAVNNFTLYVWTWVDFCMYSFLPFSVMLICSGFIITTVVHSQRRVSSAGTNRQTQKTNNNSNTYVVRSNKRISDLTRTMFTINLLFFFLTAPVVVYDIIEAYVDFNVSSAVYFPAIKLAKSIVTLLQFSNNGVHFFVYCMTIPKFKQRFKELFRCTG